MEYCRVSNEIDLFNETRLLFGPRDLHYQANNNWEIGKMSPWKLYKWFSQTDFFWKM